ATLAYEGLKHKAAFGNSYFLNNIAPRYFEGGMRADDFVKEFFAEALSNKDFQSDLDSFDLNDRKNEELVKRHYDYKKIPGKKNSLLSEIQNALLAVFNKL